MSKPKTNRMDRIRKNEQEERKKQRGRGKRDRDFFVSRIVGPRKIGVAENTIAVAEKTILEPGGRNHSFGQGRCRLGSQEPK